VTEPERITISPFCALLRSKRYFSLPAPPRNEADLLDVSRAVWCERTQEALGPDGKIVDPAGSRHGRRCFERYGAD